MKALLMVDIDYANGWSPVLVGKNPALQKTKENIENLLKKTREEKIIIAFVTMPYGEIVGQEFQLKIAPPEKCLICDISSGGLVSFLGHYHGEQFEAAFVKTRCNAFTNHALAPYFLSKNVTEIMLAGCSTFVCVLETALGATKAGFDVTLIEECSYPVFSPESERERWLMLVKNEMTHTIQRVKIV